MHIKEKHVAITTNTTTLVSMPNNARARVCHVIATGWTAGTLTFYGAVNEAHANATDGVQLAIVAQADAPDVAEMFFTATGPREPWPHIAIVSILIGGTANVYFAIEVDD